MKKINYTCILLLGWQLQCLLFFVIFFWVRRAGVTLVKRIYSAMFTFSSERTCWWQVAWNFYSITKQDLICFLSLKCSPEELNEWKLIWMLRCMQKNKPSFAISLMKFGIFLFMYLLLPCLWEIIIIISKDIIIILVVLRVKISYSSILVYFI